MSHQLSLPRQLLARSVATRAIIQIFARTGFVFSLFGVAASLFGCNSSRDGFPLPITTVSAPVAMNLYPVDGTASNPARLFIFVTAVGSHAVRMPLAFDTGSSGITLNALTIFPNTIVTSNGFNFGGGESLISYNGITVTPMQGTRTYGGSTGRTEIGNLGFATVTFGDTRSLLTTQTMPVFLYYAIQSNQVPPQTLTAETQDGWFGVNGAPDLTKLGGSTSNAPECTQSATGNCWVASVFDYLKYASGIDAGFSLGPLQLQTCDITSAGNCTPSPALTVGLSSSSAGGFTTEMLPCPPLNYTGPSTINGVSVCQAYVSGTTVSVTGSTDEAFSQSVIFDTGTPYFALNIPSDKPVPTTVDSFGLTTPSGFMYTASNGSDVSAVHVQQSSSGSVIGLGYFETNSLLIDLTKGIQGWK
jgi:hypothetical protein